MPKTFHPTPTLTGAVLVLAAFFPFPAPAAEVSAPEAERAAPGQDRVYRTTATEAEITIDGVLAEEVWQGPPTFTLAYETSPGDNLPASVLTEVWITYDQRNLYVAVRAHDPEPGEIRARLRDRDAAFQDDFVGVVLDTFDDQRRAFEFFVNPLGVQMDLLLNDVSGGEDSSWDALWDSAGRITPQGYEVEMAIPFTSLRFSAEQGEQTWGIDALRVRPRDQRQRLGLNPLPRGSNCYLCHAAKLTGLTGIRPGRNLEIAPTVTASDFASRPGPGHSLSSESDLQGGVTVSWGVTPETTLNATVNPDFSQVEADAAQLAVNTEFALFFPEKRPFFLEGADFFGTVINAVHTRTIADPDWGLKVTGKSGAHAYGAIVAQDSRTNLLFPASQSSRLTSLEQGNTSSILRYRRDLGGVSSLGGLFTSREGSDYFNRVAGVDGLWRFGGGTAVRVEVLGSQTRYPAALAAAFGQQDGTLEGFAARAAYQRRSPAGMVWLLYNDVSPDFRADLGFIPQAGFRRGSGVAERYWYGENGERWWTRWTAGVETLWSEDHSGNPLQRQVIPFTWLNGPRQSFLFFAVGLGSRWFEGQEIDRNFVDFTGEVQAQSWARLRLAGRVGQEVDFANGGGGDLVRLRPAAQLDLGRHLRLDFAHHYETLEVEGGRLYTAHVAEVRTSYQLSLRTFVRLITQYADLSRDPELYRFPVRRHSSDLFNQLLFSYKLNPQTVLFLGYADNHFAEERTVDALFQTDRTLFFKVGYALAL